MANFYGAKRSPDGGEPSPSGSKRPRLGSSPRSSRLRHEDYTVGWVCALSIELTAAEAMLDAIHPPLPRNPADSNAYTLGNIGPHNIAIACLPSGHYGNNNAVMVANHMYRSFPSIGIRLVVGIGGGLPGSVDLRLGDVVVGEQVIQSDLGKVMPDDHFQVTGLYTRPPAFLMANVAKLRASHTRKNSQIPSIISGMVQANSKMADFARPDYPDRLFRASYTHETSRGTCESCDQTQLVERPNRNDIGPHIFYGKIASANKLMRDSVQRDKLAKELGAICVEMEAAGLTDCLVIRGICDYADSHKAKDWQKYAAATAAAYARELLLEIPGSYLGTAPADPSLASPESMSVDDCRQQLLDSLDFDQKETRHINIKPAYSKTCQWFSGHTNYHRWLDPDELSSHHGFLWLDGKPAAGKSTIMKHAFNEAKKSAKSRPNHAVVGFFFHARGDTLQKTTPGMYRSLLLQIFEHFPHLQATLDSYGVMAQKPIADIEWNVETLQAILSSITETLGDRSLTCFIDALDECDDEQVRTMVEHFEELGERAFQSGTNLRICFSSRPYPHIDISKGIRFALEDQHEHGEDLEKYVNGKLRAGKSKAATEVRDEVLQKSAGVFLWIVLVVDILNEVFRDGRVLQMKKRLRELPPKLGDLFKEILRRDQRNMDHLLLCIQWILFARRPLRCEEYYFALSGDEGLVKWDPNYVTREDMERYVLSSSKGLAEVAKSKKTRVVQFIHESVRDYLVKDNGIQELWPHLAENFEGRSHDQLKLTCHTYAMMDISESVQIPDFLLKGSSQDAQRFRDEVSEKFPFMEYAARHTLYHADKASSYISQHAFLDSHITTGFRMLYNAFEKFESRRLSLRSSLTYLLAEMNCAAVLEGGVPQESSFEATKGMNKYPIFVALEKGHRDAVKAILLQELGLQDNTALDSMTFGSSARTRSYGTPLHWAAAIGHLELFTRILATSRFELNCRDHRGDTALSIVAKRGHDDILQLLLTMEQIDLSSRNNGSCTPLAVAAGSGNKRAVQLLLNTGKASIKYPDFSITSPLHEAAMQGHADIVQLLIASGKERVGAVNRGCNTPLLEAAFKGHADVVKVLLDSGKARINFKGGSQTAPLSAAIQAGHNDVVELLLATGKADVNTRDEFDRTPLHQAVRSNNKQVAKLLLADENINVDPKNDIGDTPFSRAAARGSMGIVELLLASGRADVDSRNFKFGDTPLSLAVKGGHVDVVRLLLATCKVNVNVRTTKVGDLGRTPLMNAANEGMLEIVKLLLATGKADVNWKDIYGKTALTAAALQGHHRVVKVLLDHNADPHLKDDHGKTTLDYARDGGSSALVDLIESHIGQVQGTQE